MRGVIFDGAVTASCRIQLDSEPNEKLLATIATGNPDIIGVELLRIGE